MKKVLIVDGSRDFSFNMARSLVACRDYELHVLMSIEDKRYAKLKYAYAHTIESYLDSELWIETIQSIVKKHNIDLIVAGESKTIEFLMLHQKRLSSFVQLPALPSKQSFDIANNKTHLMEFALENSVSHPKTFKYKKGADLTGLSNLKYPVLLKPSMGVGGKGIEKFTDEETLKNHLQCSDFDEDVQCQEYIVGRDICISVICKDGDIKVYTIQQSLIDAPALYAASLSQEFLYNENVLKEASKLMKSLNWQGVAHIDMRLNELTGQVYILEINPRFWGSLMSSLSAGVNFTWFYCQQMLNLPAEYKGYKHIQFMHIKTLIELARGKHALLSPLHLRSLRTGLLFHLYKLRRWLSIGC